MAQPIDIISRAMKDIGALASGETPAPEEAQDAFDMLNDMIDQWSNEDMMIFYKTEIVYPITPGQTHDTFPLSKIRIGVVSRGGHTGYGQEFMEGLLDRYDLTNFHFLFTIIISITLIFHFINLNL